MSALVAENMSLLAGAPNGVKMLRRLILELAVRGKLVSQEPSDEPAKELLKQIAAEKNRALKNTSIKQQTLSAELAEDQGPFVLPSGWSWTRLSDIATVRGGCTPSMARSEFWGGGIPWVSPKDMHSGDITGSELSVSEAALNQTSLELVPIGSILIVGRSGILKRKLPVQITTVSCTINQDLKAITPFKSMPSRYLKLMLQGAEPTILIEDVKQGTTVQSLVYERLFSRPFGLPPVAEQDRIVSKVDELMAVCDRLEAQQADAESAHAQLVETLLGSLAKARDAHHFTASWQRLSAHCHTLFTTESSIDALKQVLLQLALMGKLVRQDPSEESASVFLEQIVEDKIRLAAEGKIKVKNPLANADDEAPDDLPQGWRWARLADLVNVLNGRAYKKEELLKSSSDTPVLRVGNLFTSNHWYYSNLVLEDDKYCNPGDLLFAWSASFGPFIWTGKRAIFHYHIWKLDFYGSEQMNKFYLYNVLLQKTQEIKASGHGVAMIHMTKEKMEKLVVPVPPLSEQARIVEKLGQLIALCDQLKSHLVQARQLNEQLASTLLERAVA